MGMEILRVPLRALATAFLTQNQILARVGRTADLIVGRRHHCSIMLDRLTLNEDGSDHEEAGVLTEIPEEEMLRLDDGTPLPAELSELRRLSPEQLDPRLRSSQPRLLWPLMRSSLT